jgi:hypothetical protein
MTGLINDGFTRTVTSGLGSSPLGGAYSVSTPDFSVDGHEAVVRLRAGIAPSALMSAKSGQNVSVALSIAMPTLPTGNGSVWVYLVARRTAAGDEYRVKARINPDGSVLFGVSRFVGGKESPIAALVPIAGLRLLPGQWIRMHAQASTVGGITTWTMRAWNASTREPTTWAITMTDSTPSLQGAGTFGVRAFSDYGLTNLPLSLYLDNLQVDRIN